MTGWQAVQNRMRFEALPMDDLRALLRSIPAGATPVSLYDSAPIDGATLQRAGRYLERFQAVQPKDSGAWSGRCIPGDDGSLLITLDSDRLARVDLFVGDGAGDDEWVVIRVDPDTTGDVVIPTMEVAQC